MTMTKEEYLKLSLEDNIYRLDWYTSVFSSIIGENENNFIKTDGNVFFVKIDGILEKIEDYKKNEPLLKPTDPITVNNKMCSNCQKPTESTVGRLLANKLLTEPFAEHIEYINKQFKTSDVTKKLHLLLMKDKIKATDFLLYSDIVAGFVANMSRLFVHSSSEKTITPPTNIKSIKKKIQKEMVDRYGDRWFEDRIKVVEYENNLKKVDSEYMKGDPTDGKLTAGKIKNTARSKLFLDFGHEVGFGGDEAVFVDNSLIDGYPKDKKELTSLFNTPRAASYLRGVETQKGGSAAKDTLRAISTVEIKEGDCNSDVYLDIEVTKDNYMSVNNRYMLENGRIKHIDDPQELIGRTIKQRSLMYCKLEPGSTKYCSVCAGSLLSNYKSGASLLIAEITGILLNTSMKATHNTSLTSMNFNIFEVMS